MAEWRAKDYTPHFLMVEPTHTVKEIRAEYTKQRDILMKRANRLEQYGLMPQAEYLRELMPKLRTIETNEEVAARLAEAAVQSRRSEYSLKGLRSLQKYIEQETGDNIELGDVLEFNEFMKSWRLSAFSKNYVLSGEAVAMYAGDYQEVGGTFGEFYSISYLFGS